MSIAYRPLDLISELITESNLLIYLKYLTTWNAATHNRPRREVQPLVTASFNRSLPPRNLPN